MSRPLLRIEEGENEVALRLGGEVDISNAGELEGALAPLVEFGGDIVIDCTALTFMDSTGFRVILDAAEQLEDASRLILLSPGPLIRKTIELLGLKNLPTLEIRESAADRQAVGPPLE
jgi:anti-sigma B factor antagonist